MRETLKKLGNKIPKKPLGIILMILGFLALITPLTPGSWLIFIGLELLGFRYAFTERLQKLLGVSKNQAKDKEIPYKK